ncbi:hypothetical protein [Cytobacillus firmus]|uniref:hypothetical protein n=1 Tax=Cytobacillus firmus TaxID=1399 RepID=UPI0024C195A5|nr:hypothetical protein [Cytobacillus firmus]WHY61477.1 hypothetical protein QNH42_23395 [Cytobacillus firmus]
MQNELENLKEKMEKSILKDVYFDNKQYQKVLTTINKSKSQKKVIPIKNKFNALLSFSVVSVLFLGITYFAGTQMNVFGNNRASEPKDNIQEPLDTLDESDKDDKTTLKTVGQIIEYNGMISELLVLKEANKTIDLNPISLTINNIKLINMKVTEEYPYGSSESEGFGSKNYNYMLIDYSVQNTSEDDLRFYVPIDKVILNTDEDKIASNIEFRGKNNGGKFGSKERDESSIGFIVEPEPLKVKTVKIITGKVTNKENNTIAEPQEITFELK